MFNKLPPSGNALFLDGELDITDINDPSQSRLVINNRAAVPGKTADYGFTFQDDSFLIKPALNGNAIVFTAVSSSTSGGPLWKGVYYSPGPNLPLQMLADVSMQVSTGSTTRETINNFGNPGVGIRSSIFYAKTGSGFLGLYARWLTASNLGPIADKNSTMPGLARQFTSFGEADIDGDTVAFIGKGSGAVYGIYTASVAGITTITGAKPTLTRIADTASTTIPGTSAPFRCFGAISIKGAAILFTGSTSPCAEDGGSPVFGVYYWNGLSFTKIVAPGDTIDGQMVQDASIGDESLGSGLAGLRLCFNAACTASPNQAIYRVGNLP